MAWYVWVYIVGVVFYLIMATKVMADVTPAGDIEHPWFHVFAPLIMAVVWPIAMLYGIGLYLGRDK